MNFGLNHEQQRLRGTFARFSNAQSSMARVRQANQAGGFDPELWLGLAELGVFVESTAPPQTSAKQQSNQYYHRRLMADARHRTSHRLINLGVASCCFKWLFGGPAVAPLIFYRSDAVLWTLGENLKALAARFEVSFG